MIYTPLTQKAMKLAYTAHQGQVDQSGVPYVFHPFYVAELVCNSMPEEVPVCVALLHDVLEDTDVTLEELEAEFPKEVTESVDLLTHRPDEDYLDYVRNLKKDPIAVEVKAMDIYHNMDESRLEGCLDITDEQKQWWNKKYNDALGILLWGEKEKNDKELVVEEGCTKESYYSGALETMSYQEVYQRLDTLRKDILPHSREVMENHRFEVFATIERILAILDIARIHGLEKLEAEVRQLAESESELERFFAVGLDTGALLNGSSGDNMLFIFDNSARDLYQDLIRYMYIRAVMMLTAGLNIWVAQKILLSLLPEKDRTLFESYRKKRDEN